MRPRRTDLEPGHLDPRAEDAPVIHWIMRRHQDRDRAILGQLVPADLLDETLAQLRATGLSLVDFVLRKEITDEDTLAGLLGKHYELPRVAISPNEVQPDDRQLVPVGLARAAHVVPLGRGRDFTLAVEDPGDLHVMMLLQAAYPWWQFKIEVATRSWLQTAIDHVYGPGPRLGTTRPDGDWRRTLKLDPLWASDGPSIVRPDRRPRLRVLRGGS